MPLQFLSPTVLVPLDFWREIADLKLSKLRLSTESIVIGCCLENGALILKSPMELKNLDDGCFSVGVLHLLNTNEDFLSFDRMHAIKEATEQNHGNLLCFALGI